MEQIAGLVIEAGQKSACRKFRQIGTGKRRAVQEIEDRIMLLAAANGGRSPRREADVNALPRPSSNYPI